MVLVKGAEKLQIRKGPTRKGQVLLVEFMVRARHLRAGEKKPWDEAGGVDIELEAAVLEIMRKNALGSSSSSFSGKVMVEQSAQTELSLADAAILDQSRNVENQASGCGDITAVHWKSQRQWKRCSRELETDEQVGASGDPTSATQVRESAVDGTEWEVHFTEEGKPH